MKVVLGGWGADVYKAHLFHFTKPPSCCIIITVTTTKKGHTKMNNKDSLLIETLKPAAIFALKNSYAP